MKAHEILGSVVEAGIASGRAPGDRVVVWPSMPCGQCPTCMQGDDYHCPAGGCIGLSADGGFARMVVVSAHRTALIGRSLPIDRAVLVEPYAVALHAFDGRETADRSVAVIGIGTIGVALVDVARYLGARRVIGVSRHPENRRMAEQSGATETREPWALEGLAVDMAIDASGGPEAVKLLTQMLAHGGIGVIVGIKRATVEVPLWDIFRRELQIVGSNGSRFAGDFTRAARLIDQGRLAARPRAVQRVHLEELPDALLGRTRTPVGAKLVAVPSI